MRYAIDQTFRIAAHRPLAEFLEIELFGYTFYISYGIRELHFSSIIYHVNGCHLFMINKRALAIDKAEFFEHRYGAAYGRRIHA